MNPSSASELSNASASVWERYNNNNIAIIKYICWVVVVLLLLFMIWLLLFHYYCYNNNLGWHPVQFSSDLSNVSARVWERYSNNTIAIIIKCICWVVVDLLLLWYYCYYFIIIVIITIQGDNKYSFRAF